MAATLYNSDLQYNSMGAYNGQTGHPGSDESSASRNRRRKAMMEQKLEDEEEILLILSDFMLTSL